jgi:hypothetical protein
MIRRTRARSCLHTFAAEPWTLFEDNPTAGGGGGAPTLNEHGYPDATPVADMAPEQQTAYWRHHARKWESTAKAGPDADELTRLRERDAKLKELENANLSSDEKARLDVAAAATARAEAEKAAQDATRRALVLEVALSKSLTAEQADRLRGITKEELESDADSLKALFTTATTQTSGPQHPHGTGVPKPAAGVQSGAERYKARHGGTN